MTEILAQNLRAVSHLASPRCQAVNYALLVLFPSIQTVFVNLNDMFSSVNPSLIVQHTRQVVDRQHDWKALIGLDSPRRRVLLSPHS